MTGVALLMVSKGCERNRRKAYHEIYFHHSAIHDNKDNSRQCQHRDLNHKCLQIQSQQRSQVHAFQCGLHRCQGRIADGRTAGNQTTASGDHLLRHIKDSHRDIECVRDQGHCQKGLKDPFEKCPGLEICQIVMLDEHLDQLITGDECQHHSGNGQDHGFRDVADHRKNRR